MHDHVDARASVGLVLVTVLLLVYVAVGPKGRNQVLLSIVVLLVLVLCLLLVPRGTGRNAPTIIHCKEPTEFVNGAAAAITPALPTKPMDTATPSAAQRATQAANLAADRATEALKKATAAAEAVGAATVHAEEAEALGASAPIPNPPLDLDAPNDRDLQPNNLSPAPPLPQVAGEIPELPEPVDVLGDNAKKIQSEIELNLFRGVCPEFIPAPGPAPPLYNSLAHASTQAQLNELQANNQERIWDPYELYNRRFRLETALAEDLITFNRNEGRGPKDTHLQEITPELAGQIIAQSSVTSKEAEISDAAGIHIGHI
jgi:hypothetical protein